MIEDTMGINCYDWKYLAEGNANIIACNTKSILRIRKTTSQNKILGSQISSKKFQNMFSFQQENLFLEKVLCKLIPRSYLNRDVKIIAVNKKLLSDFENNFLRHRPQERLHKGIDISNCCVQLMPHFGFLPHISKMNCVSMEIKPKWGFMPIKNLETHPIKAQVCRFCLHQSVKLYTRKIKMPSQYCPIDLFSGKHCCMKKALRSLIKTPQNNLLVSINGRTVSPLFEEFRCGSIHNNEDLIDVVTDILFNDSQKVLPFTCFPKDRLCKNAGKACDTNCQDFGQGGILNLLCFLQYLGEDNIENVFQVYDSRKEQLNFKLLSNFSHPIWKETVDNILTNSHLPDNDLVRLCKFLLSATMKDCSIFVTFQEVTDICYKNCCVYNSKTQTWFNYQIKLVDLEPRYVHNIPFYFNLDKFIVESYMNNIEH